MIHNSCQSHCCVKHGCKYAHEDCPVVLKEVIQDYPCEDCSYKGPWHEDDAPQQWDPESEFHIMPEGLYFWWRFGASRWDDTPYLKSHVKTPNFYWSAYGPIMLPKTNGRENKRVK